jgi:chromate reductase, NAD(P)H dehydrogenase (quinone)
MLKKIIVLACLLFALPLTAEMKILALSASTRADSYNKKLLLEAADMARKMGATVTVVNLQDYPIPFYNGDLEEKEGMPAKAKQFRQLMIKSDGIIIASPEYNSSIPGMLKNLIDWTSRGEKGGYAPEAYKGKKFAIMSASPGKGGGVRGLVHLRAILVAAGGDVISKQVSIPEAHEAFDASGKLINPSLKKQLQQEIQQLIPPKT